MKGEFLPFMHVEMNDDEFSHVHSKIKSWSIQDIYLVVWLLKKAYRPHVFT